MPSRWQGRLLDRSLGKVKQHSIEQGASLIRAAARLLERSSTDGFTVRDVAEEAGLSVTKFYQHFRSKDDLLLAVFEEAMEAYAELIEAAIREFTDPADRIAAAIFEAGRLFERSTPGIKVGLSRLHLKLAAVDAPTSATAQAPVAGLFRRLVSEAIDAGRIGNGDPDALAYIVLELNRSFVLNQTLGNEFGPRLPTLFEHVGFCLNGLNARVAPGWAERVGHVLASTEASFVWPDDLVKRSH
jgi:AcrR family transcriptional regulator